MTVITKTLESGNTVVFNYSVTMGDFVLAMIGIGIILILMFMVVMSLRRPLPSFQQIQNIQYTLQGLRYLLQNLSDDEEEM